MAGGKLRSVELGRGIAACAVVAFHVNPAAKHAGLATSPWLSPLQNGVDFFFVLSGFIIFFVHRQDIDQPDRALTYVWKRFVRLFPLLWLVAGGWMALRFLLVETPSIDQMGSSFLLYPSLVEPIPAVIWTLRHEMLFYLAFCAMILNRTAGMALFGLWTLAVIGQMVLIALGTPVEGKMSLVLSSFFLDFVYGAAVAFMPEKWRVNSSLPLVTGVTLVLLFSVVSVMYDLDRLATLDYTSPLNLLVPVNGLAFALVLYGLLCIEDRVTIPEWAMLLGSASYAIYLVHVPVNSFSQVVAARLGDGLGHALIFFAGIGVGIGVHLVFEKRVTRYLRDKSAFAAGPALEDLAKEKH